MKMGERSNTDSRCQVDWTGRRIKNHTGVYDYVLPHADRVRTELLYSGYRWKPLNVLPLPFWVEDREVLRELIRVPTNEFPWSLEKAPGKLYPTVARFSYSVQYARGDVPEYADFASQFLFRWASDSGWEEPPYMGTFSHEARSAIRHFGGDNQFGLSTPGEWRSVA